MIAIAIAIEAVVDPLVRFEGLLVVLEVIVELVRVALIIPAMKLE